jgi:hypothetical protein
MTASLVVGLSVAGLLVAVLLVGTVGTLGWTVFTAIRRDLAGLLAQSSTAQQAGTRLLQELVQAEQDLRPLVEGVQREARRTQAPRDAAPLASPASGVPPLPGWLQEKIDEAQLLRATDAAVPQTVPWDLSDRLEGHGLDQAVTPAPHSRLRDEPPPPPAG